MYRYDSNHSIKKRILNVNQRCAFIVMFIGPIILMLCERLSIPPFSAGIDANKGKQTNWCVKNLGFSLIFFRLNPITSQQDTQQQQDTNHLDSSIESMLAFYTCPEIGITMGTILSHVRWRWNDFVTLFSSHSNPTTEKEKWLWFGCETNLEWPFRRQFEFDWLKRPFR